MGVKSRGNFTTMSKERYELIKWSSDEPITCKCGGLAVEKMVGDEVIVMCVDCSTIL